MDGSGFREIARTPDYRVMVDQAGLGLAFHDHFTPGPGQTDSWSQAAVPRVPFARFNGRSDWPTGTRVVCSDLGLAGSVWAHQGSGVWVPEVPFQMFSVQSILGAGVNSMPVNINTTLTAFQAFANRGAPLPAYFFQQPGRRLRVEARIVRGPGAVNAPSTQIVLGTTVLMTRAWDIANDEREQRLDVLLTTADAISVAAGQASNVINSSGTIAPGGSSLTANASVDSAAIVNLGALAQTLYVGIADTGTNSASYSLLDAAITCHA